MNKTQEKYNLLQLTEGEMALEPLRELNRWFEFFFSATKKAVEPDGLKRESYQIARKQ